jgi:hypothetical protein
MAGRLGTAVFSLALLWSASAEAHVGSTAKVNNRYYKLTPMGDRVLLSYTVFFGDEPARVQRSHMDRNHDGVLSDLEIEDFSELFADELARSVSITDDEQGSALHWHAPEMSMGEPRVDGGAFAVDVQATFCLERGRSEHQLSFYDQLRLPTPGETELFLDPAPGVSISSALLDGQAMDPSGQIWYGGPGPAQKGVVLSLRVDPATAVVMDDGLCTPPAPAPPLPRAAAWAGVIASAFGLVVGAMWIDRHRRSRS